MVKLATCQEMDAADPLSSFQGRFQLSPGIYLDGALPGVSFERLKRGSCKSDSVKHRAGNSLGLAPKEALRVITQVRCGTIRSRYVSAGAAVPTWHCLH